MSWTWEKMIQGHLTELPHMLFRQLLMHNSHKYTNLCPTLVSSDTYAVPCQQEQHLSHHNFVPNSQ